MLIQSPITSHYPDALSDGSDGSGAVAKRVIDDQQVTAVGVRGSRGP